MTALNPPAKPLGWKHSFLWATLAVACFQAAYTSAQFPASGWLIFGYAGGLIRLADQPNVRRAFYFGLATGYACFAGQLFFMWHIFSVAAAVLWLVLSFWTGLFAAIVCGSIRRWGKTRAAWLIPLAWTGVEYFRSELYYLKFSWLNIGYAFAHSANFPFNFLGMYGVGFLTFSLAAILLTARKKNAILIAICLICTWGLLKATGLPHSQGTEIKLTGVQLEFPPTNLLPKILDQALAKNPSTCVFVLSEYTLDGPVPESLQHWCREHGRFLVVGGKDPVGTNNFFDTAFVIGTNGEIAFQQAKSVPIQFFHDGMPAKEQKLWNSPWGKIGLCVCYDLSYTRVTDELIRQGAQLIIVPTMDLEYWGQHQHELHARVAPVRAAEYGIPIFRLASSGISQAVTSDGQVAGQTSVPGTGAILSASIRMPTQGRIPWDRYLAPLCVGFTGIVIALLLFLENRESRQKWRSAGTAQAQPEQ